MILLTLLLDLMFYNYTSISTYFFLLSFLNTKKAIVSFLFWGLVWDIFILHTNGYFLLLFVLLYFVSSKIKSIDNQKIVKIIIIHLIYFGFIWLFFHSLNNVFIGIIFNFLIILLGNRFNFSVI